MHISIIFSKAIIPSFFHNLPLFNFQSENLISGSCAAVIVKGNINLMLLYMTQILITLLAITMFTTLKRLNNSILGLVKVCFYFLISKIFYVKVIVLKTISLTNISIIHTVRELLQKNIRIHSKTHITQSI